MVSQAAANAIADTLQSHDCHWSREDHVLCVYLAAIARAMQELEDQFEHAVSQIVLAVLTVRRGEHRPPVPEPLARITAQAAVDALSRLTVIQHFEYVLRAVRVLAVMRCPFPEQHRAVALYCLGPLGGDVLSDVAREELVSALPRGWIMPKPTS